MNQDDTNKFSQLIEQLNAAYILCCNIGHKESFLDFAKDIANEQWSACFMNVGSEIGCFLEFKTSDINGEIILNFGKRSTKRSIFCRFKDTFSAFFKEPEFEIHLSPEDVFRFKTLITILQNRCQYEEK